MGKGDKKSKKGKIATGSFGVRRPRKKGEQFIAPIKIEAKIEKPAKAPVKSKAKTK